MSLDTSTQISPFLLNLCHGPGLADQQGSPLIAANEGPQFRILMLRLTAPPCPDIALQHRHPPKEKRRVRHSEDYGRQEVKRVRAHEILSETVAAAAGQNALVGGSHDAQVLEPQFRVIPGNRNPAQFARLV